MLSRRGFIAGLFALPIVKKLEPVVKALLPVAEKVLPSSVFVRAEAFLDAGYVWAPYIPLVVTETFLDPSDYPVHSLNKYGEKMIRTDYYGTVKVEDLNVT